MNVLASCCFQQNCKYNGSNNITSKSKTIIDYLLTNNVNIIYCCPEQLGGLSTPRKPSEIVGSGVVDIDGNVVTDNFQEGALATLKICKTNNIKMAILKDGSPSCGSNVIYDGTFTASTITGMGITSKLLCSEEIVVFTENDYQKIVEFICKLKT